MNKLEIIIRQEVASEAGKINEVNILAFNRDDEANLVDRLRMTNDFIHNLSLVAEREEGKIIGHILFTKISIVGKRTSDSLALAPMAVLPEYQKTGIGTQLVEKGLKRAASLGYDSVIVLGHKNYYPRFGFKPASLWNIKCPFEVPDEAFMAIELVEGSLKQKSGTVQYSKAFNL